MAVMTGTAGEGFTVTVVAAEAEVHPLGFVTVTQYEPEAITLIACVVAPFDQRYELEFGALSVTEPPTQNVVGPLRLITGISGRVFTVTIVAAEVAVQPLAFAIVTLYVPLVVTSMD